MGKHCKLCKIEAVKGGERSFHRFPDPQYQREAWCHALDVNIKMLKNWTFVCSDHFSPECFIYRSNGQRFLKDDAVPFPYKGQLKRIGRRKKGYKKRSLIKDDVIIKTECMEQEILNADLDREIKVENPDYLEENEEVFEEKYCLDIPIKNEVITTKESKIFDFKSEPVKTEVITKKECKIFDVKSEPVKTEVITKKECKIFDVKSEPIKNEVITKKECKIFDVKSEPIKNEVITKKECEIFDVKIEEITIEQSEIDLDNNIIDFQHGHIPETSKFNYGLDQMNGDEEKEDILPKLFKLSYPELPADGLYYCKECSFQTTFNQNLRKHFFGHRETEFRNDPEKFKEYKRYSCIHCNYLTIRRYSLSRHMVKHLPNDGKTIKIYNCDECDYSTKYRCDIVKHRVKHVPIGQRFNCTKCSYKAYDKGHLKEHMEKGHIENKQYKYECEHCPYKTDSKGALHRHVRESHSENKPFKYQCKHCSFKIDSKGSFNRHMKHGHSDISSLPVQE